MCKYYYYKSWTDSAILFSEKSEVFAEYKWSYVPESGRGHFARLVLIENGLVIKNIHGGYPMFRIYE